MIEEQMPPLRKTPVIASTGFQDLFFDSNDFNTKIDKFKNREVKAKEIFTIKEVEKTTAFNFISKFHYLKEAKFFGETVIVASSKEENYNHIPKGYTVPADADYFHCTSNNTIFGTQMKEFPSLDMPIVCDMSSDIFSRVLDFSKFDIIYA